MATTFKQARELLDSFNMTISKRDGEYRVNYVAGREDTAYYTTDLDDAVATARVMSDQAANQ